MDARTGSLPAWVTCCLFWITPPEYREAVIGDFEEAFSDRRTRGFGRLKSSLWLTSELIHSGPHLAYQTVQHFWKRRTTMMTSDSATRNQSYLAVIGFVALMPAATLLASGVMQTFFGETAISETVFSTLHPAIVLGGLMIALTLNAIPLFRIEYHADSVALSGTITLKGRWRNAMVVVGGCLFLSAIFLYLCLENFRIVETHLPTV